MFADVADKPSEGRACAPRRGIKPVLDLRKARKISRMRKEYNEGSD
jgi:hypothetical protein